MDEGEEASGDENIADEPGSGRRTEGGAVTPGGPAGGEDPLSFLRSQPQFAQMRALLQQNPALLAPLLQQLAQSNPQLLQMINDNQNEFYNMINEPMDSESSSGSSGASIASGASGQSATTGGSGGAPTGGAAGRPPGSGYITITQAEREAIDRVRF